MYEVCPKSGKVKKKEKKKKKKRKWSHGFKIKSYLQRVTPTEFKLDIFMKIPCLVHEL